MKKILTSLLMTFMITILLVGCKKKEEKIIKFEYFSSSYIEEKVDEQELLLTTYADYVKLTNKYDLAQELDESDFNNYSYIVVFDDNDCSSEREINKINYYSDKTLEIEFITHNICGFCMKHTDIYYYKIDKITDNVNIKTKYIKGKDEECDPDVTYKPILYLYPNHDMNISVKLDKEESIISSYPKYDNGWNVFVNSDGTIKYQDRDYYALYWDEYNNTIVDFSEGFYVNREDALTFLEDKLDYIGLTNRETNEFIMYWLPVLEQNEHSLVYFELTDEREKNNKIYIKPEPDSLLRINMHIKKANGYTKIKEQELEQFTRKGFTVVEWGGTIHKEDNNAR